MAIAAAVAGPAVAIQQDATYDLIWRPQLHESMTFKLKLEIDSTPEKFTFTQKVKNVVMNVKASGDYDVQTVTSDGHVLHGDHDEKLTDDDKPTLDSYNQRGEKLKTSEPTSSDDEANPGFNILDSVTDHLSPSDAVKMGATWTAMVKPDERLKRAAGKVSYTLLDAEKQGTYPVLKVHFKYTDTEREPPTNAEGDIMVSQTNFSLVRFTCTIKGAHFSDDPDFPNGDAALEIVRD